MKCSKCDKKAVFSSPNYCKEHFISHIEKTVKQTIEKNKLCTKKDKICVGLSGGKDSVTVLVILKKLGYDVSALAVDEGIKEYREKTLKDAKQICDEHKIKMNVVSFKDECPFSLDQIIKKHKKTHPCSACGVLRRYILNKHTKGFDLLATGHNLDDEAQTILMNLIKSNKELLFRSFIKSPHTKGFVQRIKPLIFLTEKEILAYTVLKGFQISYVECPYASESLRGQVRDEINNYSKKHKAIKKEILKAGLLIKKEKKNIKLNSCSDCGEPSVENICRKCKLISSLKQ